MKQISHLLAAPTSILCLLAVVVGFNFFAQSQEQRYISALAPLNLSEALNRSALQRAALRQPDLLTIFGSSEITYVNTPYEANRFFRNYPTGFEVMDVARLGASALTMAQDLAALGPDLRGKKVVISITPGTFITRGPHENFYAGNYSRLHAYEMLFSPYLSLDLKQVAARSMLEYLPTYINDPFLQFTLTHITVASFQDQFLYYLLWPLGELQVGILRLQDHEAVISNLHSQPIQPDLQHISQTINWTHVLNVARSREKLLTSDNPYGVEGQIWWFYRQIISRRPLPGSGDAEFIQKLANDREWSNFKILLKVLRQLGARPLILSRPMNVRLWEAMGVSEKAQDLYYAKLHTIVDPYHFPVVDYQQFGGDSYISIDAGSHTSPEGWVHVDQTLDAFFHDGIR